MSLEQGLISLAIVSLLAALTRLRRLVMTARKLLPALYQLEAADRLHADLRFLAFARGHQS